MALTKIKIGDKFGRLTVIGFAGHSRTKSGKSKLLVKCKCSCGNVVITPSNNLITGDTKSCGCYSKEVARETHLGKDLNWYGLRLTIINILFGGIIMALTKIKIGDKFGRLTVIGFAGHSRTKSGKSKLLVKCKCSCGNVVITPSSNLTTGDTKSCGCYHLDKAKEICTGNTFGYKHGGTIYNHRLYAVYTTMHQRCENPNCDYYDRYGGRGIYVCKEWSGENGFSNFREWAMNNGYNPDATKGECTINRIDNDGPYSPDNCEWVNRTAQMNNTSANRYLTYNGETYTVTEWANKLGINFSTIENRLCNGWSVEKTLSTPAEKNITYINYNGNNYSVAEWCYIFGIAQSTISTRIKKYGMDDPHKILLYNNGYKNQTPVNAIYFVDENERPINQQDYANGVRIGRKTY